MSSPFSRTTRSLNADSYRRSTLSLAIIILVLAAWIGWLFIARVALYETTNTARLEVDTAVRPVESNVFGRVIATNLAMGREVLAGDVLVELDSDSQRLQLNEEISHIAALSSELVALNSESTTYGQSLDQTRDVMPVMLDEARAKQREAEIHASHAAEESRRLEKLNAQGLVSDLVLLRARAEADKASAAHEALRLEVTRLEKDQGTKQTDRRAGIEGLKRQAAVIEGEISTRQATVERLKNEIERRIIRAPAEGRLGEVADLRVGSVVREGEKLGAVIPTGAIKVVAEFAPSDALGRIKPGHQARVRLEGFPWTEYGGISATVTNVASEPRGGRVRVEMKIHPDPASAIPLEHGLPGSVEVEVDRVSPAALILRAAGKRLTGIAGTTEPSNIENR